jgi:hypothetical protein
MINLDGGTIVAAMTGVVSLSSGAIALYVRATRAELRAESEKTRREIIDHINTSYVRKDHCALREEGFRELLAGVRRDAGFAA